MSWYLFTFTLLVNRAQCSHNHGSAGAQPSAHRAPLGRQPVRQMFFPLRLGSQSSGPLPCWWGFGVVHVLGDRDAVSEQMGHRQPQSDSVSGSAAL